MVQDWWFIVPDLPSHFGQQSHSTHPMVVSSPCGWPSSKQQHQPSEIRPKAQRLLSKIAASNENGDKLDSDWIIQNPNLIL